MAELPDLLTVEEAAELVRIGRTAAYQLARRYVASDGAEGMPVRRIGRQLRVPLELLEAWVGTTLHAAPTKQASAAARPTDTTRPRPAKRTRNVNDAQLSLITND